MNDKTLDKAYNDFWGEVSYRKPKTRKQIKTVPIQSIRKPTVQRISKGYSDFRTVDVRTLPTQRQRPVAQDYYSSKARAINSQANYLLAQKRLYEARVKAREAGYRTPVERTIAIGQRTGVSGVQAIKGIAERFKTTQRTSGLKAKTKAFFKKSIYD